MSRGPRADLFHCQRFGVHYEFVQTADEASCKIGRQWSGSNSTKQIHSCVNVCHSFCLMSYVCSRMDVDVLVGCADELSLRSHS